MQFDAEKWSQRQKYDRLDRGDGGGAYRFADDDIGPGNRRDQYFFQESEFPVPDRGDGGKYRDSHQAHGDDTRVHKLDEINAEISLRQSLAEAGAEYHQEHQGLEKRDENSCLIPGISGNFPLPNYYYRLGKIHNK